MTKTTKIIIAAGILAILAILTFSLTFYDNKAPENNNIKIGFIGPLSGDYASVGEIISYSVSLATKEINNKGELNIKVIYEDGKCNAKDALTAGNKLINIDKVDYILTGCSSGTLALAPIAEQNKVLLMAYASSAPAVTNAGDYTFRVYKNDLDAGKSAAEYMYRNGIRKVGALWALNDYTQGLTLTFINEFEKLGGKVVFKESFETSLDDFRPIITKMKNKGIEAVFLADYTNGVINYFEQSVELNFNVPVYGADNLDDPKIAETLGSIFDGSRYVAATESSSQGFKDKIKEGTGGSLVIGVANSYDGMNILVKAIEEVGKNPEDVKNYLYTMPVHKGESGMISFDENGDIRRVQFELREIQNGQPVVVG
jgi:branched-chain amino acid transport system substrate-binding protein